MLLKSTIHFNKREKYLTSIRTVIGEIGIIGNDERVEYIDFVDQAKFQEKIISIQKDWVIHREVSDCMELLISELKDYFEGNLKVFKTPFNVTGSEFQKKSWSELQRIPYGETISYQEQGRRMGHPKAYRAIGNANGANPMIIVIPCHRVIRGNGEFGGYSSGLERKQWLIEHEKAFIF